MSEALMRECAEEVGLQVRVGSLLWLADHIIHLPHYQKSSQAHQTEAFFRCYIHGTATPQAGNVPDEGQIGIVWLPLAQLPQLRLYPIDLRPLLAQLNTAQTDNLASYLGKIS
jgi:8-oxo-dGTP diphosphatase